MPSRRSNALRIQRFRELKATLRTQRQRLLLGADIAQAEHVFQLRQAHTRIVIPRLTELLCVALPLVGEVPGRQTREILISVLHTLRKRRADAEAHFKWVLDQPAADPPATPSHSCSPATVSGRPLRATWGRPY